VNLEIDAKKLIKSVALLTIIGFQIVSTFFPSKESSIVFLVLICLFFVLFWLIKSYDSMNFALLYFLIRLCGLLPYLKYWPMPCGFILFVITQFIFPDLRKNSNWFIIGYFKPKNIILLLITIFISSGILILWYFRFLPDLSPMVVSLKDKPTIIIALSIIGFAIVNAIVEESIFDGICYRAMEENFKIPFIFIGLQALSYSITHFRGIPSGYIGILLSFIYGGIMLGGLRYFTKGLLFPVIAHIFADLTIAILAFSVAQYNVLHNLISCTEKDIIVWLLTSAST
jgi:hypothetical protein